MPGATLVRGRRAQLRRARLPRPRRRGDRGPARRRGRASSARSPGASCARGSPRFAAGLRSLGVERGDRVVAYLPNSPAALIGFLATASIGAIWSSCSPDFGVSSVVDRFAQIEPKVLLAVDGYTYNGRDFDRMRRRRRARARDADRSSTPSSSPTSTRTPTPARLADGASLGRVEHRRRGRRARVRARRLRPPALGPLLLGHHRAAEGDRPGPRRDPARAAEEARLHLDAQPGDRVFWFTTTGWMMWNFLVGGAAHRGLDRPLRRQPRPSRHGRALGPRRASAEVTCFGTSASYIAACMKAASSPAPGRDLSRSARRSARPARRSPRRASSGSTTTSAPTPGCSRPPAAPTSAPRSSAACRSCPSIAASFRPARSAARSRPGTRTATRSSTRSASW